MASGDKKLVADYLGIKNNNGIIESLNGETVGGKILNVFFKPLRTKVTITGNADTNVDLGDDYSFTINKLHDNSSLLIEACLHIHYGFDNNAKGIWSGGTTIINCNDVVVSECASYHNYGLGHNSTTSDGNGRSMGYVTTNAVAVGLNVGDVNVKVMFRPSYGQQSDERNILNYYGVGYIKIMEVGE